MYRQWCYFYNKWLLFSLIWAKKNVFIFDPHSRNKVGSFIASGNYCLLSLKSLDDVENYVKTEYAKHIKNFNETQFDLQYVKIVNEPASVTTILFCTNKATTRIRKQTYDANEEIKIKRRDKYSAIIGTPEHDAIKTQKVCHVLSYCMNSRTQCP